MSLEKKDLGAAFLAPAAAASHHPNSVLLDRKAYFEDHDNATTAEGKTSTGHTIKITFCLADPPAVSHFCIHSPEIEDADYAVEPLVACSEMDLVLLHFSFNFGTRFSNFEPGLREYFIYRAGRGKKPSFKPIPYPGPDILMRPRILNHESLGLVPCGDGEFLLVSLAMRMSVLDYDLHIFSSKTEQWTTRPVTLHTRPNFRKNDVPCKINKVITLGRGVLGWVDLWRGILVCNVLELEDDPVVSIIPLPKPNFDESQYGSPNANRDVTCNNGLIKFIDMEHLCKQVIVHSKRQMLNDPVSTDIIYDSDLLHYNDVNVEAPKLVFVPDGWRLRSYYRHTSWDYWRIQCIVHCDDISVPNPRHSMLLPELRCCSTGKLTLRNLISAFPSLSIHDDVIYLVSKVKLDNPNSWIIGVHLVKKTLEVLEPYSAVRAMFFEPDFCPYAFSKYLNTTPDIY